MERNGRRLQIDDPFIIVIGDIHGHLSKMLKIWSQLEITLGSAMEDTPVVFLGDFCDRGPDTRGTLDWLISLKATRPRTYFIAGNHDFAFAAFLGVLPSPAGFSFRSTWENDQPKKKYEKPGWWTGHSGEEESMHLQARRWGGDFPEVGWGDSLMSAASTFQSYGCTHGDRTALLAAVPEEHKTFLRQLPWLHREEVGGHKALFVHAGLERAEDLETQMEILRERDITVKYLEQLSGRKNVLLPPQGLCDEGVTVISGHHGFIAHGEYRVVLDSSGGREARPLSVMLWPQLLVMSDQSEVWEPIEEVADHHLTPDSVDKMRK